MATYTSLAFEKFCEPLRCDYIYSGGVLTVININGVHHCEAVLRHAPDNGSICDHRYGNGCPGYHCPGGYALLYILCLVFVAHMGAASVKIKMMIEEDFRESSL